ncbi:5834_t:CDS:2 [Cetraspora pellucida]|uniref:5834_t:CDS:1 n=1 Tax=Cetraspora pellucida TaxID=1433469 RepID=A0ACA9QE03_9GLOM|nr:5834_t:CDS:2 [Cetraspora pellucida]
MPKKISKKRLDPEKPDMPLVEQPVGEQSVDEQSNDEKDFLSDERIKKIIIFLEDTKSYKDSGNFNRYHSDISALIKEKKYTDGKLSNMNNLIEQNTDYIEIIEDSTEYCEDILKNLGISGKPSSLIDGLKTIYKYSEIVKKNPEKNIREKNATEEVESSIDISDIELISKDRIKEIKTWIKESKDYKKSGVFNRLYDDISKFVEERTRFIKRIDKDGTDINSLLEQNTNNEDINEKAFAMCITIFQYLEIKPPPTDLLDGLKTIAEHAQFTSYP